MNRFLPGEIFFLLLVLLVSISLLIFLANMYARTRMGPRIAGAEEAPMPMSSPFKALIWVLVPVGAVLVGLGLRWAGEEGVTWRWKPVPGTVLSTKVHDLTEKRFDLRRRRLSVSRFVVEVEYSYEAGGKKRRGNRTRLRTGSVSWRRLAEIQRNEFKEGQAVAVFVDPNDPDRAVLKKGFSAATWTVLIFGLAFCVIAIAMA